jgi:hypothetical protein
VFSLSGHEFAAAIPRLKQLAQIPELGMPRELAVMLTRITKQQLAIIDPERAKQITTKDFAHNRDLPRTEMPSVPEINNQVYPPLDPDEARSDTASARGDGSRPVLPETTNDGPTYRAP